MATIKTTARRGGTPAKGRRGAADGLSLPTSASALSNDFRDYSILVHGEKKIGKTSLFANEPGAIFLEFDPLQKALAIYQVKINTWRELLGYITLLEEEAKKPKARFKTVVVDGVDLMYRACFVHVCKALGIDHPNDEKDYGKSWGAIKQEFLDVIHRLLNLNGMSVRFLCHSVWKEVKLLEGGKAEKLIPILPGQAEEALVGLVDLWGAYAYDSGDRVLVVEGSESIGAGHRIDGHFKSPDGDAISKIHMGRTAEEAYKNLLDAFHNKYTPPAPAQPKAGPKPIMKKKVVTKRPVVGRSK